MGTVERGNWASKEKCVWEMEVGVGAEERGLVMGAGDSWKERFSVRGSEDERNGQMGSSLSEIRKFVVQL